MRDRTRAHHGARPGDRAKPPGVPGRGLRRVGPGRVTAGYQFRGGQRRQFTLERRAYGPGYQRGVHELRRAHLGRVVDLGADGDGLAPALPVVVLVFEQQLDGLRTYLRRCVNPDDAAVIRVYLQSLVRVVRVVELADSAGRARHGDWRLRPERHPPFDPLARINFPRWRKWQRRRRKRARTRLRQYAHSVQQRLFGHFGSRIPGDRNTLCPCLALSESAPLFLIHAVQAISLWGTARRRPAG